MVRMVLLVILGVSGGLALATLFQGNTLERREIPDTPSARQTGGPMAGAGSLEERLSLLEATLQEEIASRVALQAELAALNEELAVLRERGPLNGDRPGADGGPAVPEAVRARIAERFADARDGSSTERRLGQLTQAGFSADEAQRIVQREAELRMDALYAQHEASREGEPFDRFANWATDGLTQLRRELGDSAFERYLAATGQPTRIQVRQVLASSPGEAAGLQPGDAIVAYGGERVFSIIDLNRLTLDGDPGQTVAVDVIRDGQPTQIFVPRGPIGITSERGRRGGPR